MKKLLFVSAAGAGLLLGLAGLRNANAVEPPGGAPKEPAAKEPAPKEPAAPATRAPDSKASDPKTTAPRDTNPKNPATNDNPAQPRATDPTRDPRDTQRDARDPAKDSRDTNARDPNDRKDVDRKDADRKDTDRKDTDRKDTDRRDTDRTPARDTDRRDTDRRDTDRRTTDSRRNRMTDRQLGISFGRATDRGLAISNLASSSVLYRAGLRSSDIVVSINGHRLARDEDFDRYVYDVEGNDRIKVIVFRDGRDETVYLTPTVFYAEESYDDDYTYFGVVLDTRYPDRLIVKSVNRESPAWEAGVRAGDEITGWHGQRIKTTSDFGRALHEVNGSAVDFEFNHESKAVRGEAKFSKREASAKGQTSATTERSTEPARDLPPTDPSVRPAPPTNVIPGVAPGTNPTVAPPRTPAGTTPAPATTPPPRRPLGGVLGR